MNKQEKPSKRAPYRSAWRAATPSGRSFRLRVSGRGVKVFALFAIIKGLWKILRFALTELYIILFKSNAYLTRSNGKFGSSPRRNSGGGGYHANSGHGEVDLPWVKHDRK